MDAIKNLKKLSSTHGRACMALKYEEKLNEDDVNFEIEQFFNNCENINSELLTELEVELADSLEFEMGGISEEMLNTIYSAFSNELKVC